MPRDTAFSDKSAALRDRATAPHIAEQLAAAVALRPDGAEVSLRPDELGHVRISIDRSAGETTVTLMADRPETLDLLRRHVDLLASELRGAGVHNCNFQFGHGHGAAAHSPPASFGQAEGGEAIGPAEPPSLSSGPAPSVRGGGLDLRL
ncbi:flagellar hook-length control protein FliK [Albidovulum sediminis]|uniref:Flagellar hook-length control protein FliK n=1 Tax=Albidovulum sediminis TaxID=3066345 RepID=A0ABT2NVT6_9RHOB|nr:flagellar hook-length control protein FliK [Defluviimonas sediminis]